MNNEPQPSGNNNESNSLEGTGSSTVIEPSVRDSVNSSLEQNAIQAQGLNNQPTTQNNNPDTARLPRQGFKKLAKSFNVYLTLFVLIMVIAVVVVVVAVIKNRKVTTTPSVNSQTLTQKQLEQLANSDVTVGTNKQILNVQSNTVFAGQVLVRQDLEVAGTIKVGGSLSLPGISVSGTSTFSQIQTGTLTVSGNTAFQGQLTASGGLNVSGNATFSGNISAAQITVNTLKLSGDLGIDHHISAGGTTPSRSSGSALGGGGTVSISGSDTAGSVTINTGTSPAAGCFLTINFATKFNATPHTVITPVGSAAGGIAFYVNRTTTNLSICTTNTPPASATFGFDYIVFD